MVARVTHELALEEQATRMTTTHETLSDIARALREGATSSRVLTDAAIAAHDASEDRLHAWKAWAPEAARARAAMADAMFAAGVDPGPLAGMPVSVKDLFGVPGLPVFAGTDMEMPEEWQRAGPVVAGVLRQMGVVMGKTHTVEFAFGGVGANVHWGAPVNPWSKDRPRAPGGSSSGAGVSLAQGAALVALGTDTAGSVRVPASVTGQAGLKITHGRWSSEGIVPLSPSLDTPGLLCRSVADLAYAFAALDPSGQPEPRAAAIGGLRIGRADRPFTDDMDPSVAAVFDAVMTRIASAGARVTATDLPGAETALEVFRAGGLAAPELAAFMRSHFPERIARLDPAVRLRVEGVDTLTAIEYLQRRETLARCARQAAQVFDSVDVVATPTVPISPPLMADLAETEAYRRANMLMLRNTAVANLTGLCALSLPIGLDANGMPVGLQLMGPGGSEARLLAAGLAVEGVIGRGPDLLGRPPMVAD